MAEQKLYLEFYKEYKSEVYNILNISTEIENAGYTYDQFFRYFTIGIIFRVVDGSTLHEAFKIKALEDVFEHCDLLCENPRALIRYPKIPPEMNLQYLQCAHSFTDSDNPVGWEMLIRSAREHDAKSYEKDKEDKFIKAAKSFLYYLDRYLVETNPDAGFGNIAESYYESAIQQAYNNVAYPQNEKPEEIFDFKKSIGNMLEPRKTGIVKLAKIVAVPLLLYCCYQYFFNWRYFPYESSLEKFARDIGQVKYEKYIEANDWIYSLNPEIEYDCKSFTYNWYSGEEVIQKNEYYLRGIYSGNFENCTDNQRAAMMGYVLDKIITDCEACYHSSSYYEKYGEKLEAGIGIPYKNDVTIIGFETEYGFMLDTTSRLFSITLNEAGNGTFVSKNNDADTYYSYNVNYKNGSLNKFVLSSWSTPSEFGYYDKKTGEKEVIKRSTGKSETTSDTSNDKSTSRKSTTRRRTYKRKDSYNSSKYKDADSFADDYYEEFYDYGDYEDDEDAYDAAVDYWNDWND